MRRGRPHRSQYVSRVQGLGGNTFNDGRPVCRPCGRRIKPLEGPVHPGFEHSRKVKPKTKRYTNAYGIVEGSSGLHVAPQTHDVHKRGRKKVSLNKVRRKKRK